MSKPATFILHLWPEPAGKLADPCHCAESPNTGPNVENQPPTFAPAASVRDGPARGTSEDSPRQNGNLLKRGKEKCEND